ncbi:MAG: tetratricopeptide repeat protein [Prevotella sp.]|nr:tetratricopeptide repeat protein [Prevotella sp.]
MTRQLLLGLIILLLSSCTSQEERLFSAQLDRADSLMRTRPDSSLYILNKVGTLPTTSLSMRHALLRADALNKCDSVLPSDTLLRELADYYDRHGSANERMRAHYLLGRCYHDMGEAPRALEYYQHAAEQADTTREDCDLYTLRAIYGQMADLYYAQYLPDDEMQALKTCERIAWKDHDTLIAIKAYELRFRPYYLKNDTDSILYYVTHAYQLYRKYGYNQEAANIIGMRACIYLDRHQYAEAQKDLRIYKKESGLFDKQGNIIQGREIRYYDEGRYQLGIGHVDSALYWFQSTLSYGYKEAAYKGMLDVYKQKNVPDSIAKYAELFAKANDDSYLENSMELMRIQTSLYNYQRNKKLAEQKERELAETRMTIAIIFLGILLIAWLAYRHIRKEKALRKIEIHRLTEQYSIALLEKQKTIEELHSLERFSALTKEVDEKLKSELQKKIDYLQEELRQEEEESNILRDKLQVYKKNEVKASFINSDIAHYFMRLKDKSAEKNINLPTKKDWEKLSVQIRVCLPEVFDLKNSRKSLSEKEHHLLLLILLGFRGKEITNIWGLSY